ncbi:hypothetical protein KY312_02480 [Candidatus Woesearchaeota archaeon]|nr:hypothetical protein [Candidatus Woesearchaeota archaeon]
MYRKILYKAFLPDIEMLPDLLQAVNGYRDRCAKIVLSSNYTQVSLFLNKKIMSQGESPYVIAGAYSKKMQRVGKPMPTLLEDICEMFEKSDIVKMVAHNSHSGGEKPLITIPTAIDEFIFSFQQYYCSRNKPSNTKTRKGCLYGGQMYRIQQLYFFMNASYCFLKPTRNNMHPEVSFSMDSKIEKIVFVLRPGKDESSKTRATIAGIQPSRKLSKKLNKGNKYDVMKDYLLELFENIPVNFEVTNDNIQYQNIVSVNRINFNKFLMDTCKIKDDRDSGFLKKL